jgi:hypothetical protein
MQMQARLLQRCTSTSPGLGLVVSLRLASATIARSFLLRARWTLLASTARSGNDLLGPTGTSSLWLELELLLLSLELGRLV